MNKTTINTCKPTGTPISDLRSFFVGGSTFELSDLSYIYKGKKNENPERLNKYGLESQSSGSVVLKSNVIMQKATKKHLMDGGLANKYLV